MIVHKNPVVFLDRDGTINFDSGYLTEPEQLRLISGAAWAISQLKQRGFWVVVISNQSAIGRGYAQEKDVIATNERLREMLLEEDEKAVLDRIVYCPHSPEDSCTCRKPRIGLSDGLGFDFELRAEDCWIIGDKISDLEFGANLGMPFSHCLLVATGEGDAQYKMIQAKGLASPPFFASLREAVAEGILVSDA